MSTESEPSIPVEYVAEMLGVSVKTVYRYCQEKDLPYHRVEEGPGNPYKFLKSEVLDWRRDHKPNIE